MGSFIGQFPVIKPCYVWGNFFGNVSSHFRKWQSGRSFFPPPLLSASLWAFLFFTKQLCLVSLIRSASPLNITHCRFPVGIGNSCCFCLLGAKLTVLFFPTFVTICKVQRRGCRGGVASLCDLSQSHNPNCEQLKERQVKTVGQVLHSKKMKGHLQHSCVSALDERTSVLSSDSLCIYNTWSSFFFNAAYCTVSTWHVLSELHHKLSLSMSRTSPTILDKRMLLA